MANYKGHTVGATIVCALYVLALLLLPFTFLQYTSGLLSQWQLVAAMFIVAILFGLWPDIDTNSKAQDLFFLIAFVTDIILIWQSYIEAAAYLGLLAMTPIVGKHRGWTHRKWAVVLIPLPILLVPVLYRASIFDTTLLLYGSAVSGYFSHLLLDGLIFKKFRIKN